MYSSQKEEYDNEGILINEFKDKSIIKDIRGKVEIYFDKSTEYYCKMDKDTFQDLAVKCQNDINNLEIQKRFWLSEKHIFEKLLPNTNLLHESVVFLRAVRPVNYTNSIEHPDFHRETFYSDHSHTPFVINLWIPIKDVNKKNTLYYIPKSHKIDDTAIKIEEDKEWLGKVKKHSSGHKMGFFWKPKKIISGVDLGEKKRMDFPANSYSMFSSMLVHGGAINNSDKIRFAFGFGLLPKEKLIENKSFFAAGGKDHYIDFS